MDFVPDVPEIFFNLRHYNIATSSSGRRPALNTSCSLATPAALVKTEAPLPQSPSAWRRTAAQFEFPRALQLQRPPGAEAKAAVANAIPAVPAKAAIPPKGAAVPFEIVVSMPK
ncbi:MAG: hypothetical protein ACJ8AF_02680 [Gemmatimonadaceae bacterium]